MRRRWIAAGGVVVAAVAVLTACSRPITPVVVAPLSGGPSTTHRTESFSNAGVDYTVHVAVTYHREQVADVVATLETASGDPAPQGAPLTLQAIDYDDPSSGSEPIVSPCFPTVELGREHATDRTGTVRCEHVFVVRYVVPGATVSPPSPVGPGLTTHVLVSDTGAASYDPVAFPPTNVVHTFAYTFA